MKEILIGKYKQYKANFHSHTVLSDGKLTPEEMVEAYKRMGYSILAITDHNRYISHNDLTTDDFLMINGVEINFDSDYGATYHMNLYSEDKDNENLFDYSLEYSVENINKFIKDANDNHFLVQYNHPRWSHQFAHDFKDLKGLFGFEVYNGGTENDQLCGIGDYEYETFGRMNEDDSEFPCAIADDDNHNHHGYNSEPLCDSFLGFTMVESKSLKYEDIIDAMKNRQVYASMGPYIKYLERDGDNLLIKTSEVKAIILLNERRNFVTVRDNDAKLTEATFKIFDNTKWFRIEIVDKEGKKAFTNIYRA